MFLVLAGTLIVGWLLYMGWKFYRNTDWAEPADPSPDLHGMRKRQAQLQHIQEVLEGACQQGKLSKELIDEFNRYCQTEITEMQSIETTWKNRYKSN